MMKDKQSQVPLHNCEMAWRKGEFEKTGENYCAMVVFKFWMTSRSRLGEYMCASLIGKTCMKCILRCDRSFERGINGGVCQ